MAERTPLGPTSNVIARVGVFVVIALLLIVVVGGFTFAGSSYVTGVGEVRVQPVPFSHAHHVGGLGIDCRYCHTEVEDSSFAGMPPASTCMNCHSQLYTTAPMLEPVREAYRQNRPIRWRRVDDMPDFVFFNHSIHVDKGVACMACHGRVDEMPLVRKVHTLRMGWCLDCHRHPDPRVGPESDVFTMKSAAEEKGAARPEIDKSLLTNCTACHR